jgi:hypothetical protein
MMLWCYRKMVGGAGAAADAESEELIRVPGRKKKWKRRRLFPRMKHLQMLDASRPCAFRKEED